jgi:hypothetical protein
MSPRAKSTVARAKLRAIAFLSLLALATGGPGVADAKERPAQDGHVAASLVAETRSIVPGRSFHIALRQRIEAGWHTYWVNPGDAGLPTTIAVPGLSDCIAFVLAKESGELPVTIVLSGLVLIAFAAWLYEGVRHREQWWRGWGLAASALPLIAAVAILPVVGSDASLRANAATEDKVGIQWQPFSTSKIDELRAQGRPIFVDFTADWCITCKINERVVLESPAVVEAFASNDVAALRADWTRQDAAITRVLEANARAGVPLYLFYPKPGAQGQRPEAIVLPQILSAATILREVQGQ